MFFFFFKQKTAYEMRISDWSSDVCSSDLRVEAQVRPYDLGFGGPQLKRLKVVENLRPGSEAAKAGLRNGDRLDYSDSTEGTMRHPDMKLTVKVKRDGKTFETSFLPRDRKGVV